MALLHDWLQRTLKDQGGAGTALVYRDTYLSWRGLAHRVERRAQELAGFGIGEGSWFGVMLGNVPELVILALAASKLDAVLVPLDPTTAARELDMILDAAPLRVLITRPHGGDVPTPGPVSASRTDTRKTGPRHEPEGRRRLQGTLLNVHIYKREPTTLGSDEPPSLVLFTADAAGDPKGVVRTESHLRSIAESVGEALHIKPEERVLDAAPLHHSFGLDVGLLAPLLRGATLYLEDEVSSKRLSKLLRDEKIDVFPGSPALFGALSREVAVRPISSRTARFVSSGFALAPAVADAFNERYKVRLLSAYHATETGPLTLESTGKEPATVGKPLAGVEIRLGDGSAPATADSPQPVWVRSPSVSKVFIPPLAVSLKGDGAAAVGRANAEGWFRTGDLGHLDRAGRLILRGREDDLVKIDGKRVALGEVAGCLEAFAKVREAEASLGHDQYGVPIVLARVVATGVRAEELIEHCARNLAPYKVPRQIEVSDTL